VTNVTIHRPGKARGERLARPEAFPVQRPLPVHHGLPTPEGNRGAGIVRRAMHVVVDHFPAGLLPDLDPERVGRAIDPREHEAILARAIDRAPTSELNSIPTICRSSKHRVGWWDFHPAGSSYRETRVGKAVT
jgi:hypothetical protein